MGSSFASSFTGIDGFEEKAIGAMTRGESIDVILKKRGKSMDVPKRPIDEDTDQEALVNTVRGEGNDEGAP